MKDSFGAYHPLVNFIYFFWVMLFTMVFMHPWCLLISLSAALAYAVLLNGKKLVSLAIRVMFPIILTTSLLNPAFNHQGVTIIAYFPTGNPLTLESILYGMGTAVMLVCIIAWFSCFNTIITTDKLVYFFGRLTPAMSLLLSMILRFVPRFKEQLQVAISAQKCLGRSLNQGSVINRIKLGIHILSIMLSWAMESAIETADSMRSRGYGLPGRTSFTNFSLQQRDGWAIFSLSFLGIIVFSAFFTNKLSYYYYPAMKTLNLDPYLGIILMLYFALCTFPLLINLLEARK